MFGRRRHLVQALVLFFYLLLPVPLPISGLEHGLLKFDFVDWRIYFFGIILVPGLFHLLTISFVIPLYALTVSSALYSKVFCGWVCPQNIFYEMFDGINKQISKRFPSFRKSERAQSILDLTLSILWGLIIAGTALNYFRGANTIFLATLFFGIFIFFVYDTHWLKHDFCKNACPYAYIQKSFQAPNSLHVVWEERSANKCGVCRACEEACYVGINVRRDPFNIDCTMCGACVDACDRVFSRRPEPSLLEFGFVPFEEKNKSEKFGKFGTKLGLNTLAKIFLVLSFAMFIAYFAYQLTHRPLESFRVDYPASASVNQLPFIDEGKHTNRFTLRIRSLTDHEEKYTVTLDDPNFSIIWKENNKDQLITAPFQKFDTEIWVQADKSVELEPGEYKILTFNLTRLSDGAHANEQTVYFKPAAK